jgi:hypothetical protein
MEAALSFEQEVAFLFFSITCVGVRLGKDV